MGKLRNISIKKRLFISFAVVPIILMIAGFILTWQNSQSVIKENISNYSGQMLKLAEDNITLNIEKFEQQLDEVLMSETIHSGLQNYRVMSQMEKYEFSNSLNNFLYSKLHLLSSVGEVEILNKDLSILYTQGFKYFPKEDVVKYSEIAESNPGRTIWFHTKIGKEGIIAMVRTIKSSNHGDVDGYIFVALNEKAFGGSFLNVDSEKDNAIVILDENDNYLFGQVPFEYRKKIELNGDKTIIDNVRYIAKSNNLDRLNWKAVNLTTYASFVDKLVETVIIIFLCTILFIIIVIILSRYIYKSIYNPIDELIKNLDNVVDGYFEERLEDKSNDEIGALSKRFNGLIDKINSLINEVKKEQKLKRESEIKMLQAQINPHFLFNTLNTLKWIAVMNEDTSVSNGLSSLAKLLRNTIIDSNEFVTIKEEIENIKNYIVIQKLRYGDSFEVFYNIKNDVYEFKIIKFILQPIIENSILHGFTEEKEGQTIHIIIQETESSIKILIKDNGVGFDVNSKKKKSNDSLSGVGYRNVLERIELTYGLKSKVTLKSKVNEGTEVSIILPK
ncbi:MAG: sensor histidine kinase [Clostridium sp.]|uniref:sensor histidine kinase n=1 Tax=Clostridium sp. TaxID=1506 RepID=UPI002FC6B64B